MEHTCQFSSVFNHLTPTYSTHDSAVMDPTMIGERRTLKTCAGNLLAAYLWIQTSAAQSTTRDGEYQMLAAIEINFALWGMIFCALMATTQFFEFAL